MESERYCDHFNTIADVSSGTLPKKLIEPDDNMASGDDSAKEGTQLCVIEESYIIKKSEMELRSRYDQFISSNYGMFLLAGLKSTNGFVSQAESMLNSQTNPKQIQEKKAFIVNLCQEKCAKLFRDTSVYKEIYILPQ